ncbi:hypothetical protein KFK09_020978 [Dendrobium nobile]|uniref:Uncharacterized protein n=1 Tax=Dendrobium nobile TaxID=94219 RepID=A0A8T3AP00_DENNO|nr:hypothetical protein KFK09_020978 [Dendrobium nobile]
MELPAIWPYLGLLDPTSYTHSGFRLELWELRSPMLILLKLVDLESSFVVLDFGAYEHLIVARDSASHWNLDSPVILENFVDYDHLNLLSQICLRASYSPY